MKLKQSVLIIMAAALPVVSFAASEVIPVTQDTVNVQANQTNAKRVNRNDLTYRISSTATCGIYYRSFGFSIPRG